MQKTTFEMKRGKVFAKLFVPLMANYIVTQTESKFLFNTLPFIER